MPAAKMACGVDPDKSVLEGSNVLATWATDFGGVVGGGSSKQAMEAEDILATISGGRGGSSLIASTQGGRQL